jgi:hypothetical protein
MGLSFEFRKVIIVAGLMIMSGACAWAISLPWPERPVVTQPETPSVDAPAGITHGPVAGRQYSAAFF